MATPYKTNSKRPWAAFAQEVSTICAGRTDSGVHGLMQVVHFDTELQRTPNSWVRGTNTFLPKDIAVQWAAEVPDGLDGFHSRACATARRYAYVLLQSPCAPAWTMAGSAGCSSLWMHSACALPPICCWASMTSSFRAAGCQAKSPVKTLHRIDIHYRPAAGSHARWADGMWLLAF